ncbi:hypothetical protein BJX70DRAFT_216988 [Aspergillus crustosus]
MNTNDQTPASEQLRSAAIPIARISPDADSLHESSIHSIHSVVTLIWPYSSHTKTLSALLAEPDFRIRRRSNGQVKVTFHGNVAEKVAGTHIGIGDKVYLSLAGSRLVKNDAVTQTPGRGISWDVHFDASAFLEVWRDSRLVATVSIDRSLNPPPATDLALAIPSTPVTNGHAHAHAHGLLSTTSWQSPAFLGKSRNSFGVTDAPLDPFVEEDGYVPGKGRKRPRFSMRNNEWRVIDEPESPRDKDLPEDWMNIFDEELETQSDDGGQAVTLEAEAIAVSPTLEIASEENPTGDTDVVMEEAKLDITARPKTVQEKPTNGVTDDAQFLCPKITPRSVPGPTISTGLDFALHLPTDTPRLQPIPSPGLPDPSPICTTVNSPSDYLMAAAGAAAAALSTTPLDSVPENVSELSHAAPPPQAKSDGELTHVDEDDAVTVYPDDAQILPDSDSYSGEPTSSPLNPDSKVALSAVKVDSDVEEEEEWDGIEEDALEAADEELQEEGSESEAEPFERREAEQEDNIFSTNRKRDDMLNYGRPPERLGPEDDESDGASVWSEDEEADAEVLQRQKNDKPHHIESDSLSFDESRDAFEKTGQQYEDEEENDVDEGDEDPGDEVDNEYGDYYDDEDEEQADRTGYEYDYSESEGASDYEEEPRQRFIPKHTEPEVIVLDSDSEDEISSQRPGDTGGRQAEDYSDEGSYYAEDQYQVEDEFDEADVEVERIDDEQEDEEDYDLREDYEVGEDMDEENDQEAEEEGMEDMEVVTETVGEELEMEVEEGREEEMEDKLEDQYEHTEDEQAQMVERPAYSKRGESDHIDKEMDDDRLQSQDVQELSGTELQATIALPSLNPDEDLVPKGLQSPHDYPEAYQPVTDYTRAPGEHDPLDYLAAVSESAERIFTRSEPTQNGYELAIDPSLYAFETPQLADIEETSSQNYPPNAAYDVDVALESPESKRERSLALQLDGAAPSGFATEAFEETAHISIRDEGLQLITPGSTQVFKVEGSSSPELPAGVMLPTPKFTQETAPLNLESPSPPSPPSPPEANEPFAVLENGSPSPPVSSEVDAVQDVVKAEEVEPAPPLVVVDSSVLTLPEDDQALQASIEVDDAEAVITDTNISPIDRRYPGLRSKLSYFAPLATIIDHYNALVDTISIACEVRPATKATSGKKDFILTLELTDQSMAGTTVLAQIARFHKSALPTLQEGDAILLRNFRVKSFDHSVVLVSDSTSAWAVFSSSSSQAQMNGPPVEFGNEEQTFATDLRQWYLEAGLAMVADNQLQASIGRESRAATPGSSIAPSDAGSIDWAVREARGDTSSSGRGGSRKRKSHRRITIHELRDGRRYTEVGSSPGEDSIHELRDGTVYANL